MNAQLLEFAAPVLLKATIVLALATVAARLLRERSAALRHAVWSAAVVVALILPGLALVTPELPVPLPSTERVTAVVAAASTGAHTRVASGHAQDSMDRSLDAAGVGTAGTVPSTGSGTADRVAASEASPSSLPSLPSLPLATVLLLGWLAGALVVLGRLAADMFRLALLSRRAERVVSGPVWRAMRRPALALGLDRLPCLVLGPGGTVPMTWGLGRPIVMLPRGAEAWPARRLEHVLLHELGHVRRGDYRVQLVAELVCTLYWFHPLAWLAAHRLRVERELACDDLVVSSRTDAGAYADELLRMARAMRANAHPRAVAVGITRGSGLRDRLVAILDDTRDRRAPTRGRLRALRLSAAVLALLVAAVVPQRSAGADAPDRTARLASASRLCGPADGPMERRSHHTDDGSTRVETEYGSCRSTVEIEGDVRFTDEFTSIASMGPGSLLRMSVERPGERRRLEARPGSGGRPAYRWWVEGRESAFDAAAGTWLRGALLDLFRTSGYLAEERAAWMLGARGPAGVFEELGHIESDHVRGIYLTTLLGEGDLDADELRRAVREASSIESDHTQSKVFGGALARGDLPPAEVQLLLESAAASIESDHALSKLLIDVAERHSLDRDMRTPYLAAAATIDSDHARSEVYEALLAQPELEPAELSAVLDGVSSIGSDHAKSQVLIGLADRGLAGAAAQRSFLAAARTIGSDHALSETLVAFSAMPDVAPSERVDLLETVREIGSDHAASEVLVAFAERYPLEGDVRDAFTTAMRDIGSSGARRRVEKASGVTAGG